MSLLNRLAIERTAELLLLDAIENEIENGATIKDDGTGDPHSPDSLADGIVENDTADVMLTMGYMIGSISQAWGHDVGLVFYHMGLRVEGNPNFRNGETDDQSNALYRLIMSCLGHGIALDDDGPSGPRAEGLDNAGKVLLNVVNDTGKRFDASPTNFDSSIITDLVTQYLDYPETEE